MPPRKKRSKSAHSKNNVFIFFAIVLVLAIISVIAAYYLSGEENNVKATVNDSNIKNTKSQITALEGTWVSNYDGTMLTVEGLNTTFESPSVDESNKITGKIAIEENIITFTNDNGSCKNTEGHYLYSIDEKDELFFKLIKDSCPKRLELMTTNWFKL